uniref:olfactory receptor 11A1-like n=1 Tax=Oncorhynchus gorbuscha TaxID=8017 RepID=UPI001EAF1C02|nr:olfactory receptor 11A1-like [Oncorhynchus gorbuscha]
MENSTHFKVFRLAAYGDIGQLKYCYFTVVTVLYFVIILANILLIGVICIERSLHEPMYMFLCALFVNQLYGSTGLFPALMFYLLSDTHDISLLYCYLQIYVLYTCALTEFSNLSVMSYDRYISICYPLQYNNIMTPKIICGLILLSCLSSFFLIAIIISLSLRLQFCGNVLDRLYCDNYSVVKLACSNTMLNNIWGLVVTVLYISCTIFPTIYSYVRILQICLKSSKETKQKAFNTCTPHIASMLNFLFGWLFVILQGRYETADLPPILRTILFVYFLICPPIFNPLMYGVRMVKIRHACNKFAYRPNRSTEDAISTALHSALTPLDKTNTYGFVLFPLLYCLFTYDCVSVHGSNTIVKFADDTMVVGLINDNDELAYREEVKHLAAWCSDNNVALNAKKTKELIVDYRKSKSCSHSPVVIDGTEVERVPSFKFLGVYISEDLSWTLNTSIVVKKGAVAPVLFEEAEEGTPVSQDLSRCMVESILTNCTNSDLADAPWLPVRPCYVDPAQAVSA